LIEERLILQKCEAEDCENMSKHNEVGAGENPANPTILNKEAG
jgi:hypothetical protein